MKLSKILMLFFALFMLITNPLYAKSSNESTAVTSTEKSVITSAESNVLADIAIIDKNEILLAVLATNRTKNSRVIDFAKLMIDQHGGNLSQVLQMANNFRILSLNATEAEKLAIEGNKLMLALGALQADQFDKAYVNAMVKGHQAALDLIDNQLMKSVKTESIKDFLTDTRATVVQHLEKAKKLQQNMI